MSKNWSPEPKYPSDQHYQFLDTLGFEGRAAVPDHMWKWHGYDYGWRRIMLQTRDDSSPIDPRKQWFNPGLVAQAEVYYAHKLNRRAPDLDVSQRSARTPEQIAHVRRCVEQIVANLDEFSKRSHRAFDRSIDARYATERYEEREAIRRAHADAGLSVTESDWIMPD